MARPATAAAGVTFAPDPPSPSGSGAGPGALARTGSTRSLRSQGSSRSLKRSASSIALENMRAAQKEVSWVTHTVPGNQKYEVVKNPGPGTYEGYDPKAIGMGQGVPFAGKNIVRELTAIDPVFKAQLSTPGIGTYDTKKEAIKLDVGVKFSVTDRFKEGTDLYKGNEFALKGTLGPGMYMTRYSSFKAVNPHGPPHQFGATNHDQTYDTVSPGPAGYNVVPPSKYSPQFGFGASQRGSASATFPGEEFMVKGQLGPGPVYRAHAPLELNGGVISTSKRPANDTLPRPEPLDDPRFRPRTRAQTAEAGTRRKRDPEAERRKFKAQAKAKDYSWLHDTSERGKDSGVDYSRISDGADMRPSKNFHTAPSAGFGAGPRFDEAQFIPSVRTSKTPGPGPAYKPRHFLDGDKWKQKFTTERKMKLTPGEFARRHNPGPASYNLTEEARVEEMALVAARADELEEQSAVLAAEAGLLDLDEAVLASAAESIPVDALMSAVGKRVGWQPTTVTQVLSKLAAVGLPTSAELVDAVKRGVVNPKLARAGFKSFSKDTLMEIQRVHNERLRALYVVEGDEDDGVSALESVSELGSTSGSKHGVGAYYDKNAPTPTRLPLGASPINVTGTGVGGGTPAADRGDSDAHRPRGSPLRREMSASASTGSLRGRAQTSEGKRSPSGPSSPGFKRGDSSRKVLTRGGSSLRKVASRAAMEKSLSSMQLLVEKRGGTPPPMHALKRGDSMRSMGSPEGAPSEQIISPKSFRKTKSKKFLEYKHSFESIQRFEDGRHVPSVHFAMGSRDTFERKMYPGGGAAAGIKGVAGAGPGTYKISSSSFKAANPHGPPHSFGATNHDIDYRTDSPGPAQYDNVPKSAYSPKFGFGASTRGAGAGKLYAGGEFHMSHNKGILGPALVSVHSDMKVSGGKFSTSKRPVAEPLPKPPPNPYEQLTEAKDSKK